MGTRMKLAVIAAMLLAVIAGCGETDGSMKGDGGEPTTESGSWNPVYGALSPRGSQIAFLGTPRDDPLGAARVLITGGDPVVLGPETGFARDFAWSPDGTAILIAFGEERSTSSPTTYELVSVEDGSRSVVEPHVPHVTAGIAIDPDGASAVISAQAPSATDDSLDLWRMDLQTGAMTKITDTPGLSESGPSFLDETHVVVVTRPGVADRGAVKIVDSRTGEATSPSPPADDIAWVSASGDGTIAFEVLSSDDAEAGIWRAKSDGSDQERLASKGVRSPISDRSSAFVVAIDASDAPTTSLVVVGE